MHRRKKEALSRTLVGEDNKIMGTKSFEGQGNKPRGGETLLASIEWKAIKMGDETLDGAHSMVGVACKLIARIRKVIPNTMVQMEMNNGTIRRMAVV